MGEGCACRSKCRSLPGSWASPKRYTEEAKRNGEHFKADIEKSLRALKDAQVTHQFCIT